MSNQLEKGRNGHLARRPQIAYLPLSEDEISMAKEHNRRLEARALGAYVLITSGILGTIWVINKVMDGLTDR